MPLDLKTFYASIRDSLFDRSLSQRQVDGTNALLAAWQASGHTDDRWLAYILATAYHETGRAMYPVPEGGLGKGHPYGKPGKDGGQIAYGRGYVQLTWDTNYEKADKALGLNGALIAQYNLALRPDIAARIIIEGMAEAWFTAFKLGDYLNDHLADYLHARKIVNGMDRAADIAGYATKFHDAITAAERKGADTSVVATVSKPEPATDPLSQIGQAINDVVGSVLPTPPASAPSPAAPEASPPAAADPGTDLMNLLAILSGLFSGVAGKIGVATTVATAVPSIVEGTIANISEAPKAVADIEKLVADIQVGKWGDAPGDIHALVAEFGVILKNYGINLPGLTEMVNALPSTPAIAAKS